MAINENAVTDTLTPTTGTLNVGGNESITGSFNSVNTFGFKNRFINGKFQISQRGTSGTSGSGVPTTTATYPSLDRWFAYGTGATVTVAQVSGAGNNQNLIQLTGAGSVTGAGIGQRIESFNCYDLAGQTVTLSANIANSLLTTVTWTAYYASSTDVWTSSTQIATGTFTVSSTLTNYSTQISIPSAATTGLQIIFSVGAQTSGTFQICNAQLELGSLATSFDQRSYGTELGLCQRYFYTESVLPPSSFDGWNVYLGGSFSLRPSKFIPTMRTAPSVTFSNTSTFQYYNGSFNNITPVVYATSPNLIAIYIAVQVLPGTLVQLSSGTCNLLASAEL